MRTKLVIGCTLLLAACSSEMGPDGLVSGPTPTGGNLGTATGGSGSTTGGSGSGGGQVLPPPPYAAPEGMLRRLTRTQFVNAIRDLFAFEVKGSDLDGDNHNGDFAVVGAASVVTSALGVEQYNEAAEEAANSVFSDPTRASSFVGCSPANLDDACVSAFIAKLGRRAWRRPLATDEVAQLLDVAKTAETELGTANEGLRWATVALIASPNFIYRPELGVSTASGGLKLNSFEMASRLAFLIWNSLPDDELLDAAEQGLLDSAEGIKGQVQRMFEAAAGRESVSAFAEDYLRLDRLLTQAKDQTLYPEYGPALQEGMARDMREVWQLVAFQGDQSAMDLFSTTKVFANAELARLYGLDDTGLSSTTFKEFDLPEAGPRVGILSKAAFLSQFANQKEGSPTLRGKFVREALMCTPVDPPPEGVALDLKDSENGMPMTKRQRLELHRSSVVCAGCHANMDPLGLPLESFDAIGGYRTLDNGLPVDPSGDFDGVPVKDAVELGHVMSESDLVADCLVRKYYSYALGHPERDVDGSVIQSLSESFAASGYRFKQLIVDVVTHEAFTSIAPQTD